MVKRIVASLFVLTFLLVSSFAATTPKKTTAKKTATKTAAAKPATKKKKPCAADLASCGDGGCGGQFDPNLNKHKNITPDDPRTQGDAESHDVTWMRKLSEPEGFKAGGSREDLAALGEGKKVRIFGYLLTVRQEGGESCNCGLTDDDLADQDVAVNTDNHLVLVDNAGLNKAKIQDGANVAQWKAVLAKREPSSITAEFTPRVRLSHPNFTRAAVRPLILGARQMALPVRVTGMLMLDSEHLIHNHLKRANNWEVHPILKFEYCEKGKTCTADDDAGWKSLDDMTAPKEAKLASRARKR